ncbi:MAG: hypothetical protein H6Q97_255, partial [Nitrospirae bacterium]|nr:hypothetical protein [Nitrospirota bacterium]
FFTAEGAEIAEKSFSILHPRFKLCVLSELSGNTSLKKV